MSARKKINWSRLRRAIKEAVLNMVVITIGMALIMLPGVLAALTGTFWFLFLYLIIIFVLTVKDVYDGF